MDINLYVGLTPNFFVINKNKKDERIQIMCDQSVKNEVTINFENIIRKTTNPYKIKIKFVKI